MIKKSKINGFIRVRIKKQDSTAGYLYGGEIEISRYGNIRELELFSNMKYGFSQTIMCNRFKRIDKETFVIDAENLRGF